MGSDQLRNASIAADDELDYCSAPQSAQMHALGNHLAPVGSDDGEHLSQVGSEVGALRIALQLDGRVLCRITTLNAGHRRGRLRLVVIVDTELPKAWFCETLDCALYGGLRH